MQPEDIEEKTDHKITHEQDWVLAVDRKTEKAFAETLPKFIEGSTTLGEEAYAADPSIMDRLKGDSPVWIIDPLDGTTNFKNKNPHWGHLIALYLRGAVIASWAYHPLTGEMIIAEKGAGAWANGKRLSMLSAEAPYNETLSMIFNTGLPAGQKEKLVAKCQKDFAGVTASPHGVAVYDYSSLCLTQQSPAPGATLTQKHALLMFADRPMKPWDHAGGILLVEEAGGYVRTFDDAPPNLSQLDRGILATPDQESWQAVKEKIRLATLSL